MNDPRLDSDGESDAFLTQLRELPRPAFTSELYDRLAWQETDRMSAWSRVQEFAGSIFTMRARAIAVVTTVLLLLGAALTIPALARRPAALPHSVPLEITPPTPGALPVMVPPVAAPYDASPVVTPSAVATGGSVPVGQRWETMESLAAKVGLPLLVPTYLPAGCTERERFGDAAPFNVAYLTYSCVSISQQAIVRGGVERSEQPRVGAGSTQEVLVGGQPAIYIKGLWVHSYFLTPGNYGRAPTPTGGRGQGNGGDLVWQEDAGQQLILERDGLIIRLLAPGVSVLPKEELIRIAESLQRPR